MELRTRTGLPAALAQQVWASARNKILQRAIAAAMKSSNHLNKEAEERRAAAERDGSAEGEAAAEQSAGKSLPELLKKAARDVRTFVGCR